MLWIVLLCVAVAVFWLWQHRTTLPDEPPYMPGAWPILGHMPYYFGDTCKLWTTAKTISEQVHNLGGVARQGLGPAETVYLVTNPSDIATIANACLEKVALYDFFKPWMGNGLFTSKGTTWKNHRKLLNPAFSFSVLNSFMQVFNNQARNLVKDLRKDVGKGYFDHYAYTKINSMEAICLVTNPSDIATIANACLEKVALYDFFKPWMGNGLFTSKGTTWKNHRKLLNPAFSFSVLNSFMQVFNNQARNLVKDLRKDVGKGYFDHYAYTKINSMEAICQTAIGIDFEDSELKKSYMENIDLLFYFMVARFQNLWLHVPQIFHFSKLKRTQDSYIKFQHNITNSILQRKKSELRGNICGEESLTQGTKFKSYIDILQQLSQNGVLSDKEVSEHLDTIVVAGSDTVATTLMFILLTLGAHPTVQDKVVDEIKEVFGNEDRDVEKKDLSQLIYLDAVIKESLRLYPIAPIIGRQIDKDIKLKNCTVYAGHMCGLFLYAAHLHPSWGPDRRQFRPERWLDPSQLPEDANAFLAYSVGKRTCIGKVYANMLMKTILTHFLRHYRITADDSQLKLKFDILLKPVSGYFISIENRIVST